ncbi:AbrB/MazE/SpoVT family DNA-binding domain-containing protein [Halorussus marinus]|uniref:AbrB/MazE/SpoVT family DNA-binding domain-containing protein n=1 Tax=Halorussus marinus TaxID=2505976 RepID=UPI001092F905|nr:AbrB/MazE/SpoVT family DNA-binding domain-containing protein [Halorussus marinus]
MSAELPETIVESRKVQDSHSSYHVTLPKEAVEALGIGPGSSVFFTGEAGDTSLELHTADQMVESIQQLSDA